MKTEFIEINGTTIAVIQSHEIIIHETQDVLDLMADCSYRGSRKIIIRKENIIPGFFDLKTGIAGEILQKFSNYKVQLALVGDFTKHTSKSLHDFILESNKHGRICFVETMEDAINRLSEK